MSNVCNEYQQFRPCLVVNTNAVSAIKQEAATLKAREEQLPPSAQKVRFPQKSGEIGTLSSRSARDAMLARKYNFGPYVCNPSYCG